MIKKEKNNVYSWKNKALHKQDSLPFETVNDDFHAGNSGVGYYDAFYFCQLAGVRNTCELYFLEAC